MSTTDQPAPLSTPYPSLFAFCYPGGDVEIHVGIASWRGLALDDLATVRAAWPPCESRGWSMEDSARDDLQGVAAPHGATLIGFHLSALTAYATFAVNPTKALGLISAVDNRLHSMGLAFAAVTVGAAIA